MKRFVGFLVGFVMLLCAFGSIEVGACSNCVGLIHEDSPFFFSDEAYEMVDVTAWQLPLDITDLDALGDES